MLTTTARALTYCSSLLLATRKRGRSALRQEALTTVRGFLCGSTKG